MLAQGAFKNTMAEYKMKDVIHATREFSAKVMEGLKKQAKMFGVNVMDIEVTNLMLPQDMIVPLAQAAMAQKEREAKIITAQGDYEASKMIQQAADILNENEKGIDLRYLELLRSISHDKAHVTITPDAMLRMTYD